MGATLPARPARWSYRGSLASQPSTCPPDGIDSLTDKRQRYSASKRPQGKRTVGSGNEAVNPLPTPPHPQPSPRQLLPMLSAFCPLGFHLAGRRIFRPSFDTTSGSKEARIRLS